jgi:5-formyltetrahydrofolate cyclo-ligase
MDRLAERIRMRSLRKRFVVSQGETSIQQACAQLASIAAPHLAPFKIIGSYWAMGSEINPTALEMQLRQAGHIIALPQVTSRDTPLSFARYDVGNSLEIGPIGGIPQPLAQAPTMRPDALLVPLLAVDMRGFRLGQGCGYYDRTISVLQPIFTLGLAQECQIIPHMDDAPWDEPLTSIATPTRWIICSKSERSDPVEATPAHI